MGNVEGQIALKNQQVANNKAAYDQGLADEAVRRNEAYANEHLGYGLTRRDLANITGAPINSIRLDQFNDRELQALGQQKQLQQAKDQAAIQDMITKNRAYNYAKKDLAKGDRLFEEQMNNDVPYASGNDNLGQNLDTINKYLDSIDPGLAAKWMSSYKGQ